MMRERLDPCPRGFQLVHKGYRVRSVWNTLHFRKPTETFHEFIIALLRDLFGQKWHEQQLRAPEPDRHVVMKWIVAWCDLTKSAKPRGHVPRQRVGVRSTGDTTSLVMLADDLYRLQLKRRLPDQLARRLRGRKQFQGARYEVAVAAMFVRAGCRVEWIDEDSTEGSTCEFNATLPNGLVVAVEAKSRHRRGVIHERGSPPAAWKTDVADLYRKATRKDARGLPLVVFVDVNRPLELGIPTGKKSWQRDLVAMFSRLPRVTDDRPTRESLLVATNFAWHHHGDTPAVAGEYLFVYPLAAETPLDLRSITRVLKPSLDRYGHMPDDE